MESTISPCLGSEIPQTEVTERVDALLIDLNLNSDVKEAMAKDAVPKYGKVPTETLKGGGDSKRARNQKPKPKPRASKTASPKIGSDFLINPSEASECNIFDSHCRLDKVLSRKRQCDPNGFQDFVMSHVGDFGKNFEGCITAFSKPSMWRKNDVRLNFIGDSRIWITFGCVPAFAAEFANPEREKLLRQLLASTMTKVVGLGEIGLNKRIGVPMSTQVDVFRRFLIIAKDMKLPVCVSVAGAGKEAMDIMKAELPGTWPIHLQGFVGGWEECSRWMNEWPRLKFGFTPDSFSREVIEKIPLERFLCETNAPSSLPLAVKYGRKIDDSHPGFVSHVAAQIAAIKNVKIGEVLQANRLNVRNVYGI